MVRSLMVSLLSITVAASAADLKVLSVGAIQPSLGTIAEQFKRDTGHNVTIQVDTAPGLTKRLGSGETADILIAPPDLVDSAAKEGKAVASTKTLVARVGVGISVRRGAATPNAKTVDAFKQTLLDADSIVYNEGSSGLYLEKLFAQMGIADRLKAKTSRYPNGGQVAEHIIKGKGKEIGFIPIPYIKANEATGLQFAGPLPAEVQNYTSYEAAVMTGGKSTDAAREFVRYLTGSAARQTFAAAGVD
jgi:molybdate transport system substrate-binding protein